MNGKTVFAVTVCICMAATTLTAAPINYHENWDSYATGTGDANYVANWALDPGPNRYSVDAGMPYSSPNSLKVPKEVTYGITHDLTMDALSAGQWVEPTVADPLDAYLYTHLNTLVGSQGYADIFMEVSKDGAHAPDVGANPDVVAFGMTHGINGVKTDPYIYDGLSWVRANGVGTGKAWNNFKLTITPTQLTLYNSKTGLSATVANNSNNMFNSVSVRTVDNDNAGQVRYADDVYLLGGNIVPEPGTLALLGLGLPLLLLLRRRA